MTDVGAAWDLSREPQLTPPDAGALVMLVPIGDGAAPFTYALANLANRLLELAGPREETRATEFPADAQVIALPTPDGAAPMLRDWSHVKADILAAAQALPARAREWVSGNTYRAGQLATYDDRVWRAVTALAASIEAPPFSAHWHIVGGHAGTWQSTHIYDAGEYVSYQSQWYMAIAHVTAGDDPPPTNRDRWAHLAPDLAGFRGIWAPGGTYYRGDVVWQSEHFYSCVAESVTSNTGPVADTANWDPQGTYHDDWVDSRRYAAGDMVRYGATHGIWIAPETIVAGEPAPGTEGDTAWRRVDNDEIENWAHIGATARIPRERLEAPTTGLSGDRIVLYWGVLGATLPLSQVGSSPDADRGGTMSAAQVRKLQDLVPVRYRGAWVGNQREYAAGDHVHRQIDNHAVLAVSLTAHSSTTANGPSASGNSTWATLLAVPRPDWDADPAAPAGIRNRPTIPDAHTITTHLLAFDTADIHSGNGADYWHRTNVAANSIPDGAEVCFELPYTWSPPPRLWSRWPGAPTDEATEWWLQDVTVDDLTVDRIPAPASSFRTGGGTHYHPFGFIDTTEHPRTVETREVALIVDTTGLLCFCTQGARPTVGNHGATAPAAGIRLLWRT